MLQEIETNTETKNDTVTLSASAVEAICGILTERKLEGYSLRVYVAGGGCSGVNFGMALENNIRQNDLTFVYEDVQLVIDDQSIEYLRGAKVDFVQDTERGSGFIVDSPVNAGGCSCGSKSQNNADENSAGCACGGSCGCN